jgi:transposase
VSKGTTGPRKRRYYSPEFKAEATREVLDGPRTVRSVAGEVGVDEGTLRKWVHDERRRRAEGGVPSSARDGAGQDDKARIRQLERELAEARQEAEFLKKVSRFFAREHR